MSAPLVVTGAAGFIGSHVCRALVARGERVVGVDNFDAFYDRALKEANVAGLDAARFELVELDILERERLAALVARERPRVVLHLAALAGVRPSIEAPERYAAVNVDGLVNVLDAARGAECRSIVFASSSSVYGNASSVPFDEEDRADAPISPYAATKRSGELICHSYAHLFDCAIASLRFFTVYGPGQRPDLAINAFMRRIAAGEEIAMFGDGTSSRDYTYIDDIVAGVLASVDLVSGRDGSYHRIFNLGGSQPIMLAEMIERIGAVVGRTPRVRREPMQPGDVERTFANLDRSRAELGYAPTTSFTEGLERQWTWMRESS